jgi:hypothetical protein
MTTTSVTLNVPNAFSSEVPVPWSVVAIGRNGTISNVATGSFSVLSRTTPPRNLTSTNNVLSWTAPLPSEGVLSHYVVTVGGVQQPTTTATSMTIPMSTSVLYGTDYPWSVTAVYDIGSSTASASTAMNNAMLSASDPGQLVLTSANHLWFRGLSVPASYNYGRVDILAPVVDYLDNPYTSKALDAMLKFTTIPSGTSFTIRYWASMTVTQTGQIINYVATKDFVKN